MTGFLAFSIGITQAARTTVSPNCPELVRLPDGHEPPAPIRREGDPLRIFCHASVEDTESGAATANCTRRGSGCRSWGFRLANEAVDLGDRCFGPAHLGRIEAS
jgi:hypothetical protein